MAGRQKGSDRHPPAGVSPDPSGTSQRWIVLGYVAGTHGLHGDVRVKQHNADSDLLFDLTEVSLRRDDRLQCYEVQSVRAANKGLLVHLVGVDSIEAADALRGAEICVPRSALPELAPGEFYHVDLEGLPAFDAHGNRVGVVERVCDYPASQVVRVRGVDGVWEVPMIDPYLHSVDVAGGKIVVDRLEDLDLERYD